MSDAEKPKEENKASQTDVSEHLQTLSLDKITKNSEGIIINFYSSSYTPKSDKPVQTEPSCTDLVSKSSVTGDLKIKQQPGNLASDSREIRSFEYTPASHKKYTGIPHVIRPNKLMNSRKFSDSKPTGRTATDLERKKLEAELKATEEIAKIQQTVIEKRLALELASLQDGSDYHHKIVSPQHSIPHAEPRVTEDVTRKQNMIVENNLVQDLGSLEYQTHTQPPRPPPPIRAPANDGGKICNLKTDSNFLSQTSSDLNPLRQLIEKKIHLDRRTSRTSDLKQSPPPTNSNSQEYRYNVFPDVRHTARKNSRNPVYPPPDQPSCSPYAMNNYRSRSLWKAAMTKIRKKLRPTPKPSEF